MSNLEKAAIALCELKGVSPEDQIRLGEGFNGNMCVTTRKSNYEGLLLEDYYRLKALLSVPEIREDLLSNSKE